MKLLQSICEPGLSPADKPPREHSLRSPAGPLNVLRVASHHCLTRFLQAALVVVFATLPSLSWGESLGRLFFTPDERSNLDRARLTGVGMEQEGAPAQQLESITLNGIVKRSSGKTTVWINNSAQYEADFSPSTKRLASKTRLPDFPVLVQKIGKTVTLKVGQTLNIDSGEIREIYQLPPRNEAPPAAATQASTAADKIPDAAAIGAALRNHS